MSPRRHFTSLVTSLALAAFATTPARTFAAPTLGVNPGGTGGCFASLQAAVDAAPRGATIDVAAGTYVENVVLAARTSLTIVGAGAGARRWSTATAPAASSTCRPRERA